MVTKGLPHRITIQRQSAASTVEATAVAIDPIAHSAAPSSDAQSQPRSGIDVERTVSAIAGAMVNAESTTQDFRYPASKRIRGPLSRTLSVPCAFYRPKRR